MLSDEKIFITGGAGYLGMNLVKRYYKDNEITVFSRDEAKHYYLKKQFPKVKCVIGDIRNEKLLKEASRGHTIGIFAASLKQIEAVDQNVDESLQVIVHGALNSRRAAIENGMKAACFISTDKSRGATTIYGAMKYVAGEAFVVNAEETPTRLTSVIYGNVLNSTGSVIPLIWDSIKNDYPLNLYGEEMTRFMIDIEDAMDTIEYALRKDGFNVIPNLKAFKIKDLFEIYEEEFRLKWNLGEPRLGEKYHEQMISPFEKERVTYDKEHDMFLLHNKTVYHEDIIGPNGLSSEECLVSKEELHVILKKYNFFAK
jgi:UDP-N-acetylglucosamine 4,6-dehydratase/5-epimerase